MARKIDLSIIILNYNTSGLLQNCLESVFASKLNKYQLEVIVVDNCSPDDSCLMVQRKIKTHRNLKLIENSKNLGFAAGNNCGVKIAQGNYFLFLNPDTIVYPDTLRIMLDYLESNPDVGVATCRVELPDGRLDYPCHRGFPTPLNALAFFSGMSKVFPKIKFLNGYTLTYLPLNKIHEVDSVSGSFFLIRKNLGDALRWWDEDYYWYGEDLDFCYRVKLKGWKVVYVPSVRITHYRGASSGIIKHSKKISTATQETKIMASKASTAAMRIFYQKHYQNKYPKFLFWGTMQGINLLEKMRVKRASR